MSKRIDVGIDLLDPHPAQPPGRMTSDHAADLFGSHDEVGVLRPPIVAYHPENGRYTILAGHRTVHALKRRGEKRISVEVREDCDEAEQLKVLVASNVQRPFSPMEQAHLYRHLRATMPEGQAQVIMGLSAPEARALSRLLEAPERVQDAIEKGQLGYVVWKRELSALPPDVQDERTQDGTSLSDIRKAKRKAAVEAAKAKGEQRTLDDTEPIQLGLNEARVAISKAGQFLVFASPEAAKDVTSWLRDVKYALDLALAGVA